MYCNLFLHWCTQFGTHGTMDGQLWSDESICRVRRHRRTFPFFIGTVIHSPSRTSIVLIYLFLSSLLYFISSFCVLCLPNEIIDHAPIWRDRDRDHAWLLSYLMTAHPSIYERYNLYKYIFATLFALSNCLPIIDQNYSSNSILHQCCTINILSSFISMNFISYWLLT